MMCVLSSPGSNTFPAILSFMNSDEVKYFVYSLMTLLLRLSIRSILDSLSKSKITPMAVPATIIKYRTVRVVIFPSFILADRVGVEPTRGFHLLTTFEAAATANWLAYPCAQIASVIIAIVGPKTNSIAKSVYFMSYPANIVSMALFGETLSPSNVVPAHSRSG